MYKNGEIEKVMQVFEMTYKAIARGRLDKEKSKEWWKRGQYYENGDVNNDFKMFLNGYSYGKSLANID